MASRSSRDVEEMLTALAPLVSTKTRVPTPSRRVATPVRKIEGGLFVPRTVEREASHNLTQSVSPIKHVMARRPSPSSSRQSLDSHPFTNAKIRMLINLHDSMQESSFDKDSLKLPPLPDLPKKSL